MVEANHSLQQAQLRANMSTAVRLLARQGRSKRPSERACRKGPQAAAYRKAARSSLRPTSILRAVRANRRREGDGASLAGGWAGVAFMQYEPTNFAQLTIRTGVVGCFRYSGDVFIPLGSDF